MPNFFQDIISNDPRLHSPSTIADMLLLEPITRGLVADMITDAKAKGINLMVFETFRSQERQQLLFNQRKTKLQQVGVHHYGLAADIVKDVNGQPSWDGDFSFMGKLAQAHHLLWGGDWGNPNIKHAFVDSVHVQRCSLARQPELFSGQWYPSDDYDPLTVAP